MSEPVKIVITVEGGIVTGVFVSDGTPAICTVVDWDNLKERGEEDPAQWRETDRWRTMAEEVNELVKLPPSCPLCGGEGFEPILDDGTGPVCPQCRGTGVDPDEDAAFHEKPVYWIGEDTVVAEFEAQTGRAPTHEELHEACSWAGDLAEEYMSTGGGAVANAIAGMLVEKGIEPLPERCPKCGTYPADDCPVCDAYAEHEDYRQ